LLKSLDIVKKLIRNEDVRYFWNKLKQGLGGYKNTALDIVYPKGLECIICNQKISEVSEKGLCKWCEDTLPIIKNPFCDRCGKPKVDQAQVCAECSDLDLYFDQAVSLFEYTASVQRLIYRFKYRGEQYLSEALGLLLSGKLKETSWKYDIIIPVPLHIKRFRNRGYNQAHLLAKTIASVFDKPVLSDVVFRTKETLVQAGLGRQERFVNLTGAFQTKNRDKIKDKSIVLIDDIYTTGSTVNECSRVLLESGARQVFVLTVATGKPHL